ncbi:MAG: N-acetyltransferase [Proteobacteria bacterium]|nr:MAG: N-acetyltransferase [Pseudomonadota bacterium]
MNFNELADLTFSNELVTIRRYHENDFEELNQIFDPEYFTWFFTNYTHCQEFVAEKQADYAQQKLIMYVIIDNKTSRIIGTSSLYEISFRHKRLEMGSSWLAKAYHGSQYNAVAKHLLIDGLINQCGFNRIQWKTDALNAKSHAAMTKLGFVYEGTLHRHAVTYTGRVRDSLVFAVTDQTWHEVSKIIQARILAKQSRL